MRALFADAGQLRINKRGIWRRIDNRRVSLPMESRSRMFALRRRAKPTHGAMASPPYPCPKDGCRRYPTDLARDPVWRVEGSTSDKIPRMETSRQHSRIGVVAAVTGGVIGAMSIRRTRHYKRLATCLDKVKQTSRSSATDLSRRPVPSFANRIAAVSDFLGAEQFANLQREVEALSGAERSYVPSHKKGATIAYETLIEHAPGATAFYRFRGHGGHHFADDRRCGPGRPRCTIRIPFRS